MTIDYCGIFLENSYILFKLKTWFGWYISSLIKCLNFHRNTAEGSRLIPSLSMKVLFFSLNPFLDVREGHSLTVKT